MNIHTFLKTEIRANRLTMPRVQCWSRKKGGKKREGGRKQEKGVEGARLGENGEGVSHRQKKNATKPQDRAKAHI